MDANAKVYFMCMGLCLVAGLYVYGTGRLSSDQINRIFGSAMLIAGSCNFLISRLHLLLPEPLMVALGFIAVTGFMGLITDGVIFKFWKPRHTSPMAAQRKQAP